MRLDIVEPKRGCLFTADLLSLRILEIRGPSGGWDEKGGASTFTTASALLALVHLRYVFVEAVPLGRQQPGSSGLDSSP